MVARRQNYVKCPGVMSNDNGMPLIDEAKTEISSILPSSPCAIYGGWLSSAGVSGRGSYLIMIFCTVFELLFWRTRE
jgi:hypothetical protein